MDILFTPVGNTDPISVYNEKEGSILHICRKYKPDKVYLYMSKEILEHHEKDNRYIKALEELYGFFDKKLEYEIIKKENLTDVHLYDYFYKDFREILNRIFREHPESNIYLNVSSGTPAMKNGLFILSNFLNFKTIPIQVGTPVKQSNINVDDYDPEVYNLVIEELNKNIDDFEDRTIIPEIENLNFVLKKEIISNHIKEYNYSAALSAADTIKTFLTEKSYYLIKAAKERSQLKREVMISDLSMAGEKLELYHDNRNRENEKLVEYLLYLDSLIKKESILEFIRGISPALFELFVLLFEKYFNMKIEDYTRVRKGVMVWDKNKIKKNNILYSALSSFYSGGFHFNAYVQTDHLLFLIKDESMLKTLGKNKLSNNLFKIVEELRKVERDARNIAAYEIVSISDNTLKQMTGYTSREIFNKIKELTKEVGLNISRNIWNSYDLMNQTIINSLD